MASNHDGEYRVKVVVDDEELESKLTGAVQTGVKALASLTTAIAGVGAAAIAAGSQFEKSFSAASTLFGDVNVNVDNLKQNILDMSNATGMAATDITNAWYDALSSGVEVTEDMASATKFVETNAKLAKAGFTDVQSAVNATAKVLNAYGMEVSEIDRVANIMINTQNAGIVTVNELSSVLAQVTPTAAAMGVSFEQVAAALSVMTAQGTPAAQATTQLNQLIAELGKNGTIASDNLMKAAEGTEYAGQTFAQMMENGLDLGEVLSMISNYAQESGLSMIDMFSSIEAGRAALSISQDAKGFIEDLQLMNTGMNTLDDAYEKMMDNFDAQSSRLVQTVTNMGIYVYQEMQGPLKNAFKEAADEMEDFANSPKFKKGAQDLSKLVGQIADGLLSLARTAIPLFLNGATFLVDNFDKLAISTGALVTAFAGFKIAKETQRLLKGTSDSAKLVNTAIKVLTGQMKLGTAATQAYQLALSALTPAGVVGLAIGGLSALAVGIAAVSAMNDEAVIRQKETNEAIESYTKAMEDANAVTQENIEKAAEEINAMEQAASAVLKCYDAEGNLSNKDDLISAIDDLNGALGESVYSYDEATGKIIDQNGQVVNLTDSISELINMKKAEAYLNAHQDEYNEALSVQQDAINKIIDRQQELNEIRSREFDGVDFDEVYAKYQELTEATMSGTQESVEAWQEYQNKINETPGLMDAIREAMNIQGQIDQLHESADAVQGVVDNYNAMSEAANNADWSTVNMLNNGLNAEQLANTSDSIQGIIDKINDTESAMAALKDSGLLEDGLGQQMYDSYAQSLEELQALLDEKMAQQMEQFTESGRQQGDEFGKAFNESRRAGITLFDEEMLAKDAVDLASATLRGQAQGHAQGSSWSSAMENATSTGMATVTSKIQAAWNAFSLATKRATIQVDIVSSGVPSYGGSSGQSSTSPYSAQSRARIMPMMASLFSDTDPQIPENDMIMPLAEGPLQGRSGNDISSVSSVMSSFRVPSSGTTVSDNRTTNLNQTNNFYQQVERPSDVTRAVEKANRDLVKSL